jgi:hypothetical protein
MELYNFDFNSGFYEKSRNISRNEGGHLFGIINHENAKQYFRTEGLLQFSPEVDKMLIKPTTEDKLSFQKHQLFYSGENGIYYRTFLTETIEPVNTKKTCVTEEYFSYCAGVLSTHNIFSFELPGFKIHEIGIFVKGDTALFICDTTQKFVMEQLREFMNETFFVLGPAFMMLLVLQKNYELIRSLLESYQQLGNEFIERIIKLQYKQIEDFNFIINKYELNLINLVNYMDTNRSNLDSFKAEYYPFFSKLVSNRSINIDNSRVTQGEFYEKNGGFELKKNSIKDINEYLQNINQVDNRNILNNGIVVENANVNYNVKKLTKKKPCECDAKDYLIDKFRFKGSGRFIQEIPANVCVIKNSKSCNQAFQYKSNDYYISLTTEGGKPVAFTIEMYNEIYNEIYLNFRQLKREMNDLVDKSDQILTRSFERLEFYNSRNMSILTIVSTIFLPTSFLAGWYGMNVPNIPEFTKIYAYPIIALLTVLIIIGYLYFYRDILFLEEVEYEEV